jgi:putative ABC transport system permease protein
MNVLFDLRLAVRSLLKRPGFSLTIILTMAVGIGANVGVFAYLSYFLWPTVEAPKPHEIVRLKTGFSGVSGQSSYPDWRDIERETTVFSQLAAYRVFGASVKGQEKTLFTWGHAVSGDYFSLFGTTPELGRLIQPVDDREDAEGVVVLNHLFWTRHFDADPSVIGRTVYLNGRHPYTVIGVTRPGFQGQGIATEIYIPLATAETVFGDFDNRRDRRIHSLGRLAPNVSIDEARAALAALATSLDRTYPEEEARQFSLTPVSEPAESVDGDPFIFAAKVLMAAVALLLLLACANVANLLLARSEARRREMGVLAALGANRARLSQRLLIESLLLSVSGGALGLLLGAWTTQIIEHYLLQTVPVGMGAWGQATSLIINDRLVIPFFVGVSVLTGLLFGMAPVTQILRTDLVAALKSSASSRGKSLFEMHKILVVAQLALSVVLLLGAGLLVRTLHRARGQDLGFEPRNLTLASVYMPPDRTSDEAGGKAAYQDLLGRIRALPGVDAAALVRVIPLNGYIPTTQAELPHLTDARDINVNVISPGYFGALKIPLLQGRSFNDRDRQESPSVAVVNQAAARLLWPDRSPIGQPVTLKASAGTGEETTCEVVGVVADSRYQYVVDPIRPLIYLPYQQRYSARMTFMVRTMLPIATELRQGLRQSYPDIAVIDLLPFSEQIRRSLADQRMNADIATSFGFLGLLLAATGIFAVMSYTVSRRLREFGIRLAVGATASELSRQVLRETGRLIGVGLVIGLVSAWALAKIISSILYGVGAHDALTFIAVPLVLAAIGLFAAWLPARRAAGVDPVSVLREE